MPGVPFSRACAACKKRRVKCDERKPACTPCMALARGPCPGYQHETKFVDEGVRLQKKRAAKAHARPLPVRSHSGSTTASSSPEPPRVRSGTATPILESRSLPRPSRLVFSPFALPSPDTPGAPARLGFEVLILTHLPVVHCGRMLSCLDALPGTVAFQKTLRSAQALPSYVWYIPQRLGQCKVLDTVVDLVFHAAGYLAMPPVEDAKLVLMRKMGAALSAVQSIITDPAKSLSAEMLAAVTLLGVYECINSSSKAAWMNHMRGTYRLAEKRGPSRYLSDFERQLLLASIGTIFTVAMRDDHPCFLDQPEWQDIINTKPADSMIENEWVDSYRCLPLLCHIPRLLTSCREIVKSESSQTSGKIEALAAAAHILRQSFLEMAEKYGWKLGDYAPVLAPRNSGDDWRVFCDAEDQRAANYANYLSGLAIIDRVLFAVRPSAAHLEQEALSSAMEIQYLHSFLKAEPQLRGFWLIHAERVSLSILLNSNHWSAPRTGDNGNAFDPKVPGGGNIIEEWKFNSFDDTLCGKAVDAVLMYHYPVNK